MPCRLVLQVQQGAGGDKVVRTTGDDVGHAVPPAAQSVKSNVFVISNSRAVSRKHRSRSRRRRFPERYLSSPVSLNVPNARRPFAQAADVRHSFLEKLDPPRVGATLQTLRQSQGLSLDELSRRAGVSMSMLSQIERNQANPTRGRGVAAGHALRVELSGF